MRATIGWSFSLALLGLGVGAPALADELQVPARSAPPAPADAPTRGLHMDAVLRRWGEPGERVGPVGGGLPQHPPITRWVYPGFTVYFERELVITSVANRAVARSAPPAG
jgi:hypothetical protein